MHLADFASEPERYVNGAVTIHCQSGYRAGIAAGFAEAAGSNVTVVKDELSNYRGELVPAG